MSLPSKAHIVVPGQISFIAVSVREENLITAPSVPWHSNGYASFTPAGKPTSLMMNPFMFKPLKNAIFPFPPLDGPPQRLEGTPSLAERGRRPFKPQTVLLRWRGLRAGGSKSGDSQTLG